MSIETTPLLGKVNGTRVAEVRARFLEMRAVPESTCLAIAGYLESAPLRFFSEGVRQEFSAWLSDPIHASAVRAELKADEAAVNRGFRTLDEINAQDWHDAVENEEPSQFVMLDRVVHPAYLRLTEGVLCFLLLGAARASRVIRGKSVQGLDVFNVVEELKSRGLERTCSVYDHILRNAIAHGAVDYRAGSIRYTDRNDSRELSFAEVIRATDDLLDACNAIALTLKMFFSTSTSCATDRPREVLLQELQSATEAPWWSIRACLLSEVPAGSQLIIHAESKSRDNRKILYSAMQTGVLAERLASGYSRYFISIRGVGTQLGWTAFDGTTLMQLRMRGCKELTDFVPALEKDLGFFLFRRGLPAVLTYIETLATAFRLTIPYMRKVHDRSIGRPEILVRDVESHTDPYLVRKGWVVLPRPSVSLIRDNCKLILRRVATEVRRRNRLHSMRLLGLAYVSVFASDFRLRRLKAYGLGPDLVCTLSQYRDRRKKLIDIYGSRVEIHKGVRIAWNSNWPDLGSHLLSGRAQSAH